MSAGGKLGYAGWRCHARGLPAAVQGRQANQRVVGVAGEGEAMTQPCRQCQALEAVVLGLEGLLAAYRLGSPSRADSALAKLEKARMALAQIKLDEREKP